MSILVYQYIGMLVHWYVKIQILWYIDACFLDLV